MKLAPWPIDQPIPMVCTITDVCRIRQISRRTFERLHKTGELKLVEAEPVGRSLRFTGASVRALAGSKWAQAQIRRSA